MSILFAQGPYTLSFNPSQFEFIVENGYDRVKGLEMSAITNTGAPKLQFKSHPSKQSIPWQLQRTETFKVNLNDAFAVDVMPGLAYAVGDSGYIIKHDPNTNSWIRLNSPTTVNLIGVFFLNALEGWACGENGVILHTNDGGNVWEFQPTPTTSPISDIQFLDSQFGYALVWQTVANTGTLLWTTNGGASWNVHSIPNLPSGPGGDFKFVLRNLTFVSNTEGWVTGCLWLDPPQADTLVLNRFPPGIIYHTTDGGSSWIDQTPSADYGYSEIFFIDALKGWAVSHTSNAWEPQRLFYTTDGGNSWSIQLLWEGPIIDVSFDDQNIGWLLVLRSYGTYNYHPAVLHTTNGGINWLDDQRFNCHSLGVSQINTSPVFSWVVGRSGLVMKHKFAGPWDIETWGGSTLHDVDFADAKTGWIHGDYGMILKTTDCGSTWGYQYIDELEAELIGTGIDFIDNQHGWTCGYTLAGTKHGVVGYTQDGGNNWHYIARLYAQALHDIHFADSWQGWTVSGLWPGLSNGKVWHTSDGGYNWEIQLKSNDFSRVRFFDQNYGWVVEPPFGLWFTSNGGSNWNLRPLERFWVDVCPLNEDSCWAVGGVPITVNPKVGFTSDMGLTWDTKELNHPGHGGRGIEFVDPTFGWVVGQNGLILGTVDAGITWFKEESGVPYDLLEIRFPDPYHGYAVGERGTVLYRYIPYNLSASPLSTAYQSSKISYSLNQSNFWTVYQSADRISASVYTSTNAIERKLLGDGEYPCVALDALNNPSIVWQQNVEPTPVIGGGELWFSRFDGTNWTEPYRLASFTGPYSLDVNLPSFTIDPRTNTGYVVFEYRDRFLNGPNSHLLLGWFDILNPGSFQYTQLEVAPHPERCEFPSISLGGNYLYIAFQREHKIFRIKWDIINHQIVNRTQVSEEGRFSHHPYVDVQANGVINYVWEDSIADNIEIHWAYEWDNNIIPRGNVSNTPGKSQWPQICKGTTWITWSEFIYPPTDNNWEICYKDMEYEGYQILSQTLEMSKYSHGVVTRSPYWPPPYEPKLTAIWTEGNQAPYEIRVKTVALPEIPFFYADAGKEYPSPWTVQREGYIQFAPEPEKTIDYHPQKLIYHFQNLNPEKRYRIKLVFYFESQSQNRWKMKIDADNIFHANLWIKPAEVTTLECWLPTACYKDGEIYLNIKKIVGAYALVSQIFIYEYERETKEITKNTQESGSLPVNEPGLFIKPNPMHSVASISYSLPNDESQPINLKIYDATGRLVRQWNRENVRMSNQFIWNGDDENGKALPSGIYFLVLENGDMRSTQKVILVK